MKELTIFIPTYRRCKELKRLLDSIYVGNKAYSKDVDIVISSNAASDKDTITMIRKYQKKYNNIYFYINECNIGIDANHDKIYEYCKTNYALCIADDDYFKNNILEEIINQCHNDFTFGFINALPTPPPEKTFARVKYTLKRIAGLLQPLYKYSNETVKAKKAATIFSSKKYTPTILPMLPYYSGIIINLRELKKMTTKASREIFNGTMHQYIGSLWNATLKDDKARIKLISEPLIYVTIEGTKSWTEDTKYLINNSLPRFYSLLVLDEIIRERILAECSNRTRNWLK